MPLQKTSRPRTRRVKSEELPPEPPVPPPPAVATGSVKILSYPVMVIGLMLIAAAALGIFQASARARGEDRMPREQAQIATPPVTDDTSIIERVATHLSVNPQETPTVISIQNPDTLRAENASFYKDAEIGDRLLVWSDKAVLFSVRRNLILNMVSASAPGIREPATTTESVEHEKENASVEVRNGSAVVGLGKAAAEELIKAGLSVLPAKNAGSKQYQKTTIFLRDGSAFPRTVLAIENILGLEDAIVNETTEVDIKGDILVVIGSDLGR